MERGAYARHRADHKNLEGPLMPILHAVQHAFGHVPEAAVPVIAEANSTCRAPKSMASSHFITISGANCPASTF